MRRPPRLARGLDAVPVASDKSTGNVEALGRAACEMWAQGRGFSLDANVPIIARGPLEIRHPGFGVNQEVVERASHRRASPLAPYQTALRRLRGGGFRDYEPHQPSRLESLLERDQACVAC